MPRNRKRKQIQRNIARGAKRYKRSIHGKYRTAKKMSKSSTFKRAVMRVVNHNAEVKECLVQLSDNRVLTHNSVMNLNTNAFQTSRGTDGEGNAGNGTRVGNKIFVKKLRMSIMIEAQQYRPLTTYWLYLVRLKGALMDTTINAKSQMFEGTSTTIPCDFLDTSKCDVLFVKKFVLRMPNLGSLDSVGVGTDGGNPPGAEGGGTHITGQANLRVTNPQWIEKFNVVINKTIVYRDTQDANNEIPHSYRYQWVMTCYDNYTSAQSSTWPCGHVTLSQKMSFTDV